MLFASDEKQWQQWGSSHPYYAVLTHRSYQEGINHESKNQFLETGERHVAYLLDLIKRLDPNQKMQSALDFGCGVGRVTLPLTKYISNVVGVDHADTMLAECRRNLDHASASAKLYRWNELVLHEKSGFDLVHSYLVFQHISPQKGMNLLRELLNRVNPGGIAAIHVPIFYPSTFMYRMMKPILYYSPLAKELWNQVHGRPRCLPCMNMYTYSSEQILNLFHQKGFQRFHCHLSTHGKHLTYFIVGKRKLQS